MLSYESGLLPPSLSGYLLILLAISVSYLLGSIPSGLLLGRLFHLGDVRQKGSGNIGATNLYRQGGKFLGILTLEIDMLKTLIAIIAACLISMHSTNPLELVYISAGAAVVGHIFPIWLKGKGGKGVACFLAVILAFNSMVATLFIASWILLFALSRMVSFASLGATASSALLSIYACGETDPGLVLLLSFLLLLIFYAHRHNIQRLLAGKEHRFVR